ncbi:MAG: hypothetical protein IPM85_17200 [Chitinophagaceae bacterium]|nr:hypothetical protein [Chitinophagaceae bacterium]
MVTWHKLNGSVVGVIIAASIRTNNNGMAGDTFVKFAVSKPYSCKHRTSSGNWNKIPIPTVV